MTLALLANPTARVRAEAAWKILFNGTETTMQAVETDSGPMIAVYFPLPDEGATESYGVQLENDPVAMELRIKRVKKKSPIRPRGDCPKCDGSEDCQDCYPIGSGTGTSGQSCISCNGSGDCAFCNGSGDCYTCGGGGLTGGCSTCGDEAP